MGYHIPSGAVPLLACAGVSRHKPCALSGVHMYNFGCTPNLSHYYLLGVRPHLFYSNYKRRKLWLPICFFFHLSLQLTLLHIFHKIYSTNYEYFSYYYLFFSCYWQLNYMSPKWKRTILVFNLSLHLIFTFYCSSILMKLHMIYLD